MNGEDSTLEDEYVQEFVLDQFENGPIKQEVGTIGGPSNNNNNEEEINQNSIQNIPHHYQRLPSIIPPPMMINSPPHHLLTPPDNLNDNYHQHHRQVVLKASNLILYPNIPGTPPDTPPVSNSPSPQTNYLDQNYHPHIQQMPKGMGYNDMIWPPADRRNRQEPLDLRPTCNDNVSELQNWNVMQQSTSVIASNGKRIVHQHTDYTQLIQNQSSNSPYCKPLCNGGLISPASTSSRTNSLNGRNLSRNSLSTSISCGTDIDDDTLVNLSVRDLNMRLKSLPREEVVKLKLKRRTLKNRGYAQNCRSKRVMQKNELETTNRELKDEIKELKMKYHEVVQERDSYKRRWEILASGNPNHLRRGAMHSDVYL